MDIDHHDTSKVDEVHQGFNTVKLNNNIFSNINNNHRTKNEWLDIFPSSAFFHGFDQILKDVIIMVYEDPDSKKISTVIFSSFGELCFNSLTLDNKSRFFVACENLQINHRKSNVRRALAITLLKTYSSIDYNLILNSTGLSNNNNNNIEWDETIAGEMASQMQLVKGLTPENIGSKLISLGYLQPHFIESTVLDVIYEDNPEIIESNNKLVYLLGEQVEQLFDPLTEYSPEDKIQLYQPPLNSTTTPNKDDGLSNSICNELLKFQENQTKILINFLQNFVIPLRVKVLNNEFQDLNIEKFNQIFPPTIDEITRINCILLEALQTAIEFGSFEIVKACGLTLPHFYKAYMRHESALKLFSSYLKKFCRDYPFEIQPNFSELKLETIMNSSINLTKFKLILERLINTKNWENDQENELVKFYYKNSVETIDSFAKDNLKPYSKRIFTPSGKVLTEIVDGVPSTLTYGWLNRKVVSVFDAKNLIDLKDDVIVLFNDYVIFASVDNDHDDNNNLLKPKISDIIMNSLMNEKPMKNIPNLKIRNWSMINDFEITTFNNNNLKIIFNKNGENNTLVYKVENSNKFLSLLNKAKILNKSTPFHLFKSLGLGFTIYSTAHEKSIYSKEISKSSIALFLNVDLNSKILIDYNLFAAISATYNDEDDTIILQNLDISSDFNKYTINSSDFSNFIPEILSSLELQRHNYKNSKLLEILINSNNYLLKSSIESNSSSFAKNRRISSSSQPVSRRSSYVGLSRSSTRNTSINYNKPLPEIKNLKEPTKKEVPEKTIKTGNDSLKKNNSLKKNKLKNRLSQIFSSKKSKKLNDSSSETKNLTNNTKIISQPQQSTNNFHPIEKKIQNFSDDDESEIENDLLNSSMEDCTTFESSMTPIFDDDDYQDDQLDISPNIETLRQGYKSENWLLSRDNSSRNFALRVTSIGSQISNKEINSKTRNLNEDNFSNQLKNPKIPENLIFESPPQIPNNQILSNQSSPYVPSPGTTNSIIPSSPENISEKPILGTAIAEPLLKPIQRPIAKHFSINNKNKSKNNNESNDDDSIKPRSNNLMNEQIQQNNEQNSQNFQDSESSISNKIPTFNSLDDDFNVNILKIGYESLEDLDDENNQIEDVFYTPKSITGDFPQFETLEPQSQHSFDYLSTDPRSKHSGGIILNKAFDQVQTEPLNEQLNFNNRQQLPNEPSLTEHLDTESTENFELNSLIWASPSLLNSRLYEDSQGLNIVNDESFGYLAGVLDNSVIINEGLKNSETFKTLPRSFSSIKYLGAYIDNDTPISKELYEFLDE
ncbi:Bud site selection protein [Wickerhamomyces ciferrii]|uniref:Bud site selection protein n=1 Tax=Wickerhamomyces ciferrii (strain ATCC 14091 / BCRC 22168 / CBS 111 / JCM 3599 / NBRC 0793 / NRRL Y-1031 F-60-10) TaxID=1206466 RepID=K0KQB2_WICCF|nr:Bud site selection protein [Wickerhamomyces ciferrii]CCH43413.1 Bud site selection protein [Wickerhamomyces ciferrii]